MSDPQEILRNLESEHESWGFFFREAADKFRDGEYTAEYEAQLISEFEKLLPEVPPWKK